MAVIDNRIVEIKFENHLFEEKVDKTINVLEKLKKALNFDKEAESFDKVEEAANKMDFSSIEKSLNSLNDKFSTFGIAGMTVISELTSSALNLAETLAKKVLNPIVTKGWSRATNIDNAKFQLEGFGVAWEKIENDINYGVKETAYGLDSAAKAASQLVASGVEFGETFGTTGNSPMAKALRGISGVAAITNSTYDDIAGVYEAIAGRGKVSAMELNRLALRGMNAAQTLAKSLNVTEEELRDMVSDGEVSFQQFSEAMDEAFGPHAKEANKTFEGSLANMKAALSRIGAEFAAPYRSGMIPIFNALRETINDIKVDKLKPLYADFADFAEKASNFVTNVIGSFKFQWIKDLAGHLHGIYTEFDEFMTKFSPFWKSTKEDAEEASKSVGFSAEKITEAVNKVLAGEYGNGEERRKAIEEAFGVGAFELIQNKVNETLGDMYRYEETITVIGDKVQKALSPFEELKNEILGLRESGNKFGHTVDDLREDVKSLRAEETQNAREAAAWQHVYENIGDTFSGIGSLFNIFKRIISEISKAMAGPMGNVALNLATAFTNITAAIGRAIAKLDEFLEESGTYKKIGDIATTVGNAISQVFKQVSKFVESVVKGESSLSKIFPSFEKIMDSKTVNKLSEFFKTLLSNLNEFAMGLSGNIIDDAFTIIGQILTGAAENIPKITKALPAIITALRAIDLARSVGSLVNDTFNAAAGIGRAIKSFVFDIETDALLKLAGAIAILAASLAVLSLIPVGKLVKAGVAIWALGVIIVQLYQALSFINNVSTGKGFLVDGLMSFLHALNAEHNAEAVFTISKAFAVLAASMWALGHLSWDQLKKGALAIGAITLALGALIFVVNKTAGALSRSPIAALATTIYKFGNALAGFIGGLNVSVILGTLTFAVIAIAGAVAMLSKIKFEDGMKAVFFIGLILTELVVTLNIIKDFAGYASNGVAYGIFLFFLGNVVTALGKTLKRISDIPLASGLKAVFLLGVILLELVGTMKLISMVSGDENAGPMGGLRQNFFMKTIAKVADSLATTLKKLSKIGLLDGLKAVWLLGLILTELIATMAIMSDLQTNDHPVRTMATLLVISLVAGMLAGTIKTLAKIPFAQGLGALILLGGLMTEFYLVMQAMSKLGSAKGAMPLATMIGFALAIRILSGAIVSLGQLSLGAVASALVAIGGVSYIMVLMQKAFTSMGSPTTLLSSILGILPAVIALGAVVIALKSLAQVKTKRIAAATKSIVMVLSALTAVSIGLKFSKDVNFVQALGMIASLSLLVFAIAGIFWLFKDLKVKQMTVISDSLTKVITSLALMSAAMGLLGGFGGVIGANAVNVDIMLANIAAIMVIAAYIEEKRPDIRKFMEKGIPLLETLGEGLGSLVGGFLSKAIFEPLGKSFTGVAEALTNFIENLKPFIEGTKDIPEDTSGLERLGDLMSKVGDLGIDSWISSVKGAFADTSGLKSTFKNLNKFIKRFNEFKSKLDGFSSNSEEVTKLEGVKAVLEKLGDISWQTFKDAFIEMWVGETNLSKSFNNVKGFVEQITDLNAALEPISSESDLVDKLGIIQGVVEKLGSVSWAGWLSNIVQSWTGQDTLLEGVDYLILFSEKFAWVSKQMASVSQDNLDKLDKSFDVLDRFADLIPGTSGVAQLFTGKKDLAGFGSSLETFGTKAKNFFSSMDGIDVDGSDKVSWALLRLTHVFEQVMTEGSLSDPAYLGERLNNIVHNLDAIFKVIADDISDDQAKTPLLEAGEKMFDYLLEGFETAGEGYSEEGKISGSIDKIADSLIKALKGDESEEALDKEAVKFIEGIVTAMTTAITENEEPVTTTLTDMLKNAINAGIDTVNTNFTNMDGAVRKKLSYIVQTITSFKDSISNAIATAFSGAESKLRSYISSFQTLGGDIMGGLIKGIEGKQADVATAASTAASASLDSAKTAVDSHSPSRKFMKLGENMMEGLQIGVSRYQGLPINAVSKVAGSMVNQSGERISEFGSVSNDAMAEVMATILGTWVYITSMIDQDMEWHPVISPVLDLTNLQNGMTGMDSILSTGYHFGATGVPDIYANRVNVAKTGDLYNQEAIVSQIRSLRSEIATLGEAISNMQVIMSTGQVVGAVTPGIDRELGSIQKYNARWA